MQNHKATKEHVEREDEETERLVRPSPKLKPPRTDSRRERVHADGDPDLDSNQDTKSDKDLSLNYKGVGGSLAVRVYQRYVEAAKKLPKKPGALHGQPKPLKVKALPKAPGGAPPPKPKGEGGPGPGKVKVKTDKGWVGWVSEESYDPSKHQKVTDEKQETGVDKAIKPMPIKQVGGPGKTPSDTAPGKDPKPGGAEVIKPMPVKQVGQPSKPEPEQEEAPAKVKARVVGWIQDSLKGGQFDEEFLHELRDIKPDPKDPHQFDESSALLHRVLKLPSSYGFQDVQKVLREMYPPEQPTKDETPEVPAVAAPKEAPKTTQDEAPTQEAQPEAPTPATAGVDKLTDLLEKQQEAPTPAPAGAKTPAAAPEGTTPAPVPESQPDAPKNETAPSPMPAPVDPGAAPDKTPPKGEKKDAPSKTEVLTEEATAEARAWVEQGKAKDPEFQKWAEGQRSVSSKDETHLFPVPSKDGKGKVRRVPFDQLPPEEKTAWANRYLTQQRGDRWAKGLSEVSDPKVREVLRQLGDPNSELYKQLKSDPESATLDIRKALPDLKDTALPEGLDTIQEIMGAAQKAYPPIARRKFTPEEAAKARDEIALLIPNIEQAVDFLSQHENTHPDDLREMGKVLRSLRHPPARQPKDASELADVAAHFYATDPAQVKPPKSWVVDGKEVPFDKLSYEQQAAAMQAHRYQTVAASYVAKHNLVQFYTKSNVHPEIAEKVADFRLRQPAGETSDARLQRAAQMSKGLFAESLENPVKVRPSDKDIRRSLISLEADPAAQMLATANFLASDYQDLRKRFLSDTAQDRISEHDSDRTTYAKLMLAERAMQARAKKLYPEGALDRVLDPAQIFRERVLGHLDTLNPERAQEVRKRFYTVDADRYDRVLNTVEKDYESAKAAYQKQLKAYEAEQKSLKDWQKAEDAYYKPKTQHPYRGDAGRTKVDLDQKHKPPKRPKLKNLPKPAEPEMPRIPPPPDGYDELREDNVHPLLRQNAPKDLFKQQRARVAFSSYVGPNHWMGTTTPNQHVTMGQDKHALYHGKEPYEGTSAYPAWQQVHTRDLGPKDYDAVLKNARVWLRSPVLSKNMSGVLRDTQLRAALDLAIRTEQEGRYSEGFHPRVYNDLLSRLAGEDANQTIHSVLARSRSAETSHPEHVQQKGSSAMTPKFAKQDADSILARLDRIAHTIQKRYAAWGMPFDEARTLVNQIDKTADEIEVASFGAESFDARKAEVLQKDSDESYMDTFESPMAPVQTDSDEPYMKAYSDDQSSAVVHGKSTTGRPLAP